MGWFSRTFRGIKKGVKKIGKATGKAAKGVKKAAQAVHRVVKKTGLTKILSTVLSGALKITNSVKNRIEGVIKKLPYGEEALLIAQIAFPQYAALNALLANGQQLNDFVSHGKINIKRLLVNAVKKRVPGWQKLEDTYGKFQQTKEIVDKVKSHHDTYKDAKKFIKTGKPNIKYKLHQEASKRVDANLAQFFDNPKTHSTLREIDPVKKANDILRQKPLKSAKATGGALQKALKKKIAQKKKSTREDAQTRFRQLLSRRR